MFADDRIDVRLGQSELCHLPATISDVSVVLAPMEHIGETGKEDKSLIYSLFSYVVYNN